MILNAGNRRPRPDDSFNISLPGGQCHNICINTSKLHRVFVTNRSQHRSVGSDAFKPLPLVTLSGPGEGLPQVLCGPRLADDARGEPKMRIGVRVGAIRCFSAPQTRPASLARHLLCYRSGVVRLAFPHPGARSRPFDPGAVLRDHQIVPAHALAVRCCRCAGEWTSWSMGNKSMDRFRECASTKRWTDHALMLVEPLVPVFFGAMSC